MPISDIQRERLERSLEVHEARLRSTNPPLNAMTAAVHQKMLRLGRDPNILVVLNDFVDSPELAHEVREQGSPALRSRGVDLPEGVTVCVVDEDGESPHAILRAEIRVRSVRVFVDWHPEQGVSTRVQRDASDVPAAEGST